MEAEESAIINFSLEFDDSWFAMFNPMKSKEADLTHEVYLNSLQTEDNKSFQHH